MLRLQKMHTALRLSPQSYLIGSPQPAVLQQNVVEVFDLHLRTPDNYAKKGIRILLSYQASLTNFNKQKYNTMYIINVPHSSYN